MLKYIKALQHTPTIGAYLLRDAPQTRDDLTHLKAAVEWLLVAQEKAAGTGYAHSYHFAYGWQPAYPETTGYILPTLLKTAKILNDARLKASVNAALRWLCAIQAADGSFADLGGNPQVFDTGQILIGLNDIVENYPEIGDVKPQITRAAQWLVRVQNDDGSFIKHAYNNRPHTYYSRVGAALIKAGQLLGDESIVQAGLKNIEWTIAHQLPSGFFNHVSFDDQPPFLHTMAYVIEGLLEAHALTKKPEYHQAALRFIAPLRAAAQRDLMLRSQYNAQFEVENPHYCVTGLAQWAGICFGVAQGEDALFQEGVAALNFVARHQIFSSNQNIHGALTGSLPLSGNYLRYACPNWGVKFFIDGLIAKRSMQSHDA